MERLNWGLGGGWVAVLLYSRIYSLGYVRVRCRPAVPGGADRAEGLGPLFQKDERCAKVCFAAALPSQTAQTQTRTEAGVVSFISDILSEVAKLVATIG